MANLITQPETFDNAYWNKNFVTVTADSVTAPNGALTADTMVEAVTGGPNEYAVYHDATSLLALGSVFTVSCYLKAATRTAAMLRMDCKDATNVYAYFNLTTGAVGETGGTHYISSASANANNGWWRTSLTANIGAGVSTDFLVMLSSTTVSGGSSPNYSGTNLTNAIYLWGAQLEIGPLTYYLLQRRPCISFGGSL